MDAVKEYIDIKKLCYSLLFIIGAIILPQVFHMVGWVGPTFLPMHIPVILAGVILGKKYGLITGITAPLLSTLITGMPVVFPMLPIMILELGAYGFIAGVLFKKDSIPMVVALLGTMIVGRIAYALGFYGILLFSGTELASSIAPLSAIVTGIPGIIIQILVIPMVVKMLEIKGRT